MTNGRDKSTKKSGIHTRAGSALLTGLAVALVGGGVAIAQGASGSGSGDGGQKPAGHPPPPPGLLPMKGLTNGVINVQKDGKGEVIHLDQGKISSVGADSITLTENDGNDVTIPYDSDTKVLAGPGKDLAVADLSAGTRVLVVRDQGDPAKVIAIPPPMIHPKKGEKLPAMGKPPAGMPKPPQGMGQLPPPPVGQ